MGKCVDIYRIIGISPSDVTPTSALLSHWRKAAQMWHPEKLNALKVHFPFTPTAELKVMAEEKIRALTSIKSLVKELSADPAKKVAYDRLLAAQNSPPSSPDHPPHRAPPASGSHSRAEQNTRDPLKESPERREKVVEGTLCGSGIYTWLGNARIKGSVHGSVILTVQGDLCITGDLEGKCIVRGRNIFIEGHVSGAPVVTASGRVVIEGNRGPDALIKAAGGVIVKGHDCSQSQEPRKNSYDPGKDRPYRSPFTSRSSPEDRVPPSASVGFHTNGSWRLIDGIMTTFGATRTWIDGDGDVLLILNADIDRNGQVFGGRVLLNNYDVSHNIYNGVDLSRINSPLAARFQPRKADPRPGM